MKFNTLRIEVVAVGQASVLRALRGVTACAACSESASRPFETVVAQVLGGAAEYFLCSPAQCPRCASPIMEQTLVSTSTSEPRFVPQRAEDTDVVFIDESTLNEAQAFVSGCENCRGEEAEMSFDQILDAITGCDPTVTEYVICHAAHCPQCRHEIMEKTLILAN